MNGMVGNTSEKSEIGLGSRQAQVHEQVDILGCALQSLTDSVIELTQRLNSVMREPNPQCEEDRNDAQPTLVPLASRISEVHYMAANANGIVIDILGRLEI